MVRRAAPSKHKEKAHEVDYTRAREGRSGRLPVVDQEVRRRARRVRLRPARQGDGRGKAPRRRSIRRRECRARPPREGVLVRGDREEVQARKRPGAGAARPDRERRRHRQHPVPPGGRSGPERRRRRFPPPRLSGRPCAQCRRVDRLRRALRLLPGDGAAWQAERGIRRLTRHLDISRVKIRSLETTMALTVRSVIAIPDGNTDYDHGAFDPKTRRVFIAHTARDRVEVIDHDTGSHLATLQGFPEAAGVVAADGSVLVTNRGAASLAWLDAATLQTRAVFPTAPRPNGVALTPEYGIAACIGDAAHGPELHAFELASGRRWTLTLPGRPRWCVVNRDGTRVFVAIRDPSMVLAARVPD